MTKSAIGVYTAVYSDYYPGVYSKFYSHVHDADAAHDLSQELFTRFYEKFSSIEDYGRWINSAVRYILLEYYRKTKGDSLDIESVLDSEQLGFVNGFRDSRIVIQQALDNVEIFEDERSMSMFHLIALYNYTYEETAECLGMTKRQVRYRYGIVVDRLLDHFRKAGIHGVEDLL